MASDSDKTSGNQNSDGFLKSNKKQESSGNLGNTGDKGMYEAQTLGKGGRHLSLPIETATTNGDLCEGAAIGVPKRVRFGVLLTLYYYVYVGPGGVVKSDVGRVEVSGVVEGPRVPTNRPPWRCYGPMLTHSRSDGDFPIYAKGIIGSRYT
ncbi:unnamed protein product, partial [Iphiclides podalirius]